MWTAKGLERSSRFWALLEGEAKGLRREVVKGTVTLSCSSSCLTDWGDMFGIVLTHVESPGDGLHVLSPSTPEHVMMFHHGLL